MAKKRKKWLIVGMTVMLCCLAYIYIYYVEQAVERPFYITINTEGSSEQISAWKDENGGYYVFLPSYADLSKAQIKLNTIKNLDINSKEIADGSLCDIFEINIKYNMEFSVLGKARTTVITFVQSANIATMYVDTESGSIDYIHSKKRNKEAGTMRLYRVDGGLEYFGELKSISGRGNATWDNAEKKPYEIDLGTDTDLLDMGAARDWILLANAFDSSNMRNKIVFDFAKEAGLTYSPEATWVDLYLNDEYKGLYLLTEQNEVHQERVEIDGEGSFLVSLERHGRMITQNLPYVETREKQTLRVRYPKEPTIEELSVLEHTWQSVEDAILAENGIDGATGKHWTELIDLDSWVRKYLIEEVFGNIDASLISQYFYYDGNSNNEKVFAGPVWDYDGTMGRHWQTADWNFLIANRAKGTYDLASPWFHELYKKEEFQDRLKTIFREDFLPLIYDLCNNRLSNYDAEIKIAAEANRIRWQMEEYGIENLRDYLLQRMEFLNQLWLEEKKYHAVDVRDGTSHYVYYMVAEGECAELLPTFENSSTRTFLGWYDENGVPFDATKPIFEDVVIYSRWSGVSSTVSGYAQYFMPLAVIACMGVGVLWADIRRMRKGG